MVIAPWMWGVGILGVAGVGVVAYEVTRPKPVSLPVTAVNPTVASKGATTTLQTVTPQRPQPVANPLTTPNFGLPIGPIVTLVAGATLSAAVPTGQNLTLILPSGAKGWRGVGYGSASNLNDIVHTIVPKGQVALGNDLTSPITLTVDQLAGSNALFAAWTDANGAEQEALMTLALPKVVVLRP